MIEQRMPACPVCGESDPVEKVSSIYLQGIGAGRNPGAKPEEQSLTRTSKAEVTRLRRLLAPPSSGRSQVIRPIHPDLMLLVFTGVLPIFLVGIAGSQSYLLVPAAVVLVVFYLFYFWRRNQFIDRYNQLKLSQVEDVRRVERAIGRWMKAYYCARDEVVFDAGRGEWVPVDRAEELMWAKMRQTGQ